MKITALKSFGICSPVTDWTYVKVETDEPGVWGWGECSLPTKTHAVQGAIQDLEKLILTVLTDDARSGTPAKFTPEQVAAIIALACEPPAQSGPPVSHWTPTELAREAIKRKIVVTISPRHIDRFLASRTSVRTRASTG